MTKRSARPGFSLAEVLVATVLLGVIGGALTRMVVDQMRFFDNVSAVRGARSTARNAMNVLLSDLRMVQDQNGVIAASTTSITLRVPFRFGVFCGNTGAVSTVSMLPTDSAVAAIARYAGYGWRTPSAATYTIVVGTDSLSSTGPATSAAPALCTTTAGVKTVTVNGRPGAIMDLTTIMPAATAVGSPVFFWQKITYSFAASGIYPGTTALWRSVQGGVTEELMAPFLSTSGFKFYLSGADASTTTVPANLDNITGVDVVLNAVGTRTPAGKASPPRQTMVTAVFFKNVR